MASLPFNADERSGGGRFLPFAAVGGALALSVLTIWLATRDLAIVAIFAATALALAAVLFLAGLRGARRSGDDALVHDWGVTQAALEDADAAVAITDRAGRLVCANRAFVHSFTVDSAPPSFVGSEEAREPLERLARDAWRDGSAELSPVYLTDGQGAGEWRAQVRRGGAAEDHLIWRLTPVEREDLVDEIALMLLGKLGEVLGENGVQAAVVDRDGLVIAANEGFAHRAGTVPGNLPGSEFVSWLRSDEHERIFFTGEGKAGLPLRLIHLPVADPHLHSAPDPLETPSLMLLIDSLDGGFAAGPVTVQIEQLLARLPLGLAMTDRDGRMLFANRSFRRAAGVEDLPSFPTDLVIAEDKGPLSDAVRRTAAGTGGQNEVTICLAYAPDEPVTLGVAPVTGLGECAVLLTLKDTTEEARLKREIAQATKMQAVGQLAGGVAHDFNNVLTAIIGFCDLMLMRHIPGDSDYDDIQQIKANSNRAAALTRQLLAFSRQQTLRPEILQLPDVVSEVSTMLKRLIGEKIAFEVEHDRDLGPVRADPTQLEHVIINLAVNARDAMLARPDARLKIATRRVTAEDVRAMRDDILPIGDYTALVVEDNGSGIAPDHVGKIFEPFFTTKERGKGTGLGLSTVYGIVKQSGGFIFANSEPGKGTRFTIYLPVYAGALPVEEDHRPVRRQPANWSRTGGRILLVEDEDMVRAVAERALIRQGYTVTAARDGDEGLELVEEGGEFDLIVSDVVMPAMDGPAMVRAIREVRPELPVLFMSGYAEQQLRNEIDLPQVYFLPKPFSVTQIADAVGSILAGQTVPHK